MSELVEFRPINEDHAIVSVTFSLGLSGALRADTIAAVENAHDLWREALPASAPAEIPIEIGGKTINAPGMMFAFVQPDASPMWSMTVGGSKITVECFLYTRWARVWEDANSLLQMATETVFKEQPKINIKAVELTVKDEFLAERSTVDFERLLRRSDFLPARIFGIGPLWHCNNGWFEPEKPGPLRHLHNLDIVASARGTDIAVSVSHFQRDLLEQEANGFGEQMLRASELMEALHRSNKNLLQQILVTNALERIGLN